MFVVLKAFYILSNCCICRCRHGYFHVVNNDYTHWEMYAIGGSASPTINSQGNRFLAPNRRFNKEVSAHKYMNETLFPFLWVYGGEDILISWNNISFCVSYDNMESNTITA